ncbi:hypothetical protein M8C21_008143 [Ambrosia artemisiifolia]|uniref:Uncharacterized protein n=1 Tax=Ambrosia artemisiifolia TaxID=4212 RepID=A0AAD5CKP8_AMBAR|nr:hypothetical protein M8C21_008143 [Ambrosia artemisiifolia]
MGNPNRITLGREGDKNLVVDKLNMVDISPKFETSHAIPCSNHHSPFTFVELVQVLSRSHLKMHVWDAAAKDPPNLPYEAAFAPGQMPDVDAIPHLTLVLNDLLCYGAQGTLCANEKYQLQVDLPEHYVMEASQIRFLLLATDVSYEGMEWRWREARIHVKRVNKKTLLRRKFVVKVEKCGWLVGYAYAVGTCRLFLLVEPDSMDTTISALDNWYNNEVDQKPITQVGEYKGAYKVRILCTSEFLWKK